MGIHMIILAAQPLIKELLLVVVTHAVPAAILVLKHGIVLNLIQAEE